VINNLVNTYLKKKNADRKKKQLEKREIENFLVDAIESFETHDYENAIRRFQLITKAYPDHSIGYLFLGRAFLERKQYERGIEALYEHLKVVPESVEAMIYLGLAYYECHEYDLAQHRFEEALKLRTSSLLAQENLVITKITAGRLDDALDDLTILQKEHPGDKLFVELLVLTLGRLGKWEAAKQLVADMEKSLPPAKIPEISII
jgi:tetratricopeptide (TPR) repeat protein